MRLSENGQCPECKRRTYGRVRYNADFLHAGPRYNPAYKTEGMQPLKVCRQCRRVWDFETGEQIATTRWAETSPEVFERVPEAPIVAGDRRILPQSRMCESFEMYHNGHALHISVGRYPDGKLGEVFIDGAKIGSDVETACHDAAVTLSIMMQHNIPLDVIRHAVTREASGLAASIIGAVVDRLKEFEADRGTTKESGGDSIKKAPYRELTLKEVIERICRGERVTWLTVTDGDDIYEVAIEYPGQLMTKENAS